MAQPPRAKCEADAQSAFDSTIGSIDIKGDTAAGAVTGAAAVPVVGCVGAALPVTELGPGAMWGMCRLGAAAATNSETIAMGAGAGAAMAAWWDNIRGSVARTKLSMAMKTCSYIP